jgi:glycosyltransferase involved in cell wall biosynthesis
LLLLDADDWEQDWNGVNQYSWPVARFLAWQEEWGLRHADGVTVASRWLESKVHAYAPGCPALYLPNGITPAAVPAVNPSHPRGKDVLFFSRFVEIEPIWLAQFWSCLHEFEPEARLLVAGTPVGAGLDLPFRTALNAIGPGHEAVQWLGYVEAEQTAALMASVGCAIFPAAPTPLQLAKCSVRLASTLLAGAPVVASATGEQAAYGAGGAACLLPPDASPADFAAAVTAVLRQPELQLALAAQAREQLLQRYRWDDLGDRLLGFYGEMQQKRMVTG